MVLKPTAIVHSIPQASFVWAFLPFRNSGFLDGPWRPPSEHSSPNHNFRSCRFGISMHRSVGSPEPPGEGLRGLAVSVAGTGSSGYFHRFKRPTNGRWDGLEHDWSRVVDRVVDLLCLSNINCVGFNEPVCVFCLLLIVKTQESACISFPRLTTTRGLDPGKYYLPFRKMT